MKRLLANVLWGCGWGLLLAALAAPLLFALNAGTAEPCCDMDAVLQGWGAVLNLAPWGLLLGALAGAAWWLAFNRSGRP